MTEFEDRNMKHMIRPKKESAVTEQEKEVQSPTSDRTGESKRSISQVVPEDSSVDKIQNIQKKQRNGEKLSDFETIKLEKTANIGVKNSGALALAERMTGMKNRRNIKHSVTTQDDMGNTLRKTLATSP